MNYFVLAWLVRSATGMSYAHFVDDAIWKPAGMAPTAYIANDTHGDNLGYCCFYATDRDYARFGLLYLRSGTTRGHQVVPRGWVSRETAPSASFERDYGLGWWLDDHGRERDFMAIGLGGQYIYVSCPQRRHRRISTQQRLQRPPDAGRDTHRGPRGRGQGSRVSPGSCSIYRLCVSTR